MGDIADILGYAGKPVQDEATKILLDRPKNYGQPKPAKKPKGMSREVYDLIGNDAIAPAMQPNNVGPSFKNKRSTVLKGKWIWDVIRNSAREDSKLALYHWVKADMHYSDYPYAKFNVRLDDLTISREEYDALRLQDPLWTYEDTVALMQTSTRYDLRWPVVFDKLVLSVPKRVEELQARYYHVSAELHAAATQEPNDSTAMDTAPTDPTQQPPSSSGFGVSKSKFNLELETARRKAQDQLFRKYDLRLPPVFACADCDGCAGRGRTRPRRCACARS